ncbi:MAG TPA: hypothetical protein VFY50_02945, partial [Candidatus Nitrosocosmicus sp.]|nr:hypothetical protein [Candidatus Nitrosocosmicus sp.]
LVSSFSVLSCFLLGENLDLLNALASPYTSLNFLSSNPVNMVREGNTTISSSNQVDGKEDISKVIVIPNPNQIVNNSGTSAATTSTNESSFDVTKEKQQQPRTQNSNVSNSANQNEIQRGEYLVDDNGVHYYNINNCSMVKGSSGIGDLSECEDAEREIQEELTG